MRAVAVVNGNARRVRGGLRAKLERVLPGGVRFTTSLDHARVELGLGAPVTLVALGP